MTPDLPRRLSPSGLTPLAVASTPVAVAAWFAAGPTGLVVATVSVTAAVAIWLLSELLVLAAGVVRPLERLMLGMLIRAGGAFSAIALAVFAGGMEPKLVAGVAAPLYGSLIAGELLLARQLQPTGQTD